ncbi:anti-sigma factor family protein [Piscinibacter terrae]|uniref:Anti-sigma factor n=1 Tax=Piscinibacter terrae TaxID=2496871 RepID=A0A3N7HH82_9BURK|nr:anti-sigma factor [Albitalea terrae]RQP21394.1 anti-sigma factor [Albitalea terrae]
MSSASFDPRELTAFVDGELDLPQQLALEERLAQEPALAARVDEIRQMRELVRGQASYHRAPAALRQRLLSSEKADAVLPPPSQPHSVLATSRAGLGWGLALLLAIAWGVSSLRPATQDPVLRDLVASHVRASMGERLIDVPSSDRHTVKPWLSSRLDYSPPVLDAAGPAVLAGARVDYAAGRPVAVLVYRQHQHVIDVFVWPAQEADSGVSVSSRDGLNVAHRVHGGMAWWAVSDIQPEELPALLSALGRAPAGMGDRGR